MIRPERTTGGYEQAGLTFLSDLRQPPCPVLREQARNRLCELRQDPLFDEWQQLTALLGIDLSTYQLLMDEREDAPLVAGVARSMIGADGDGAGIPLAPDRITVIGIELAPSWQGADGFAPPPSQYGK